MEQVFREFKFLFENRYNSVSVLDMGEDSLRYDFFSALQRVLKLNPWDIYLESPIHADCYIKRGTKGSKRNEKPQVDLLIKCEPFGMCVEFAMFKRNSNPHSSIAVTENTIKMLNDFIRLGLHSRFAKCNAYFVCVADKKMLDYQLFKVKEFPCFPGEHYKFDFNMISSLINTYKSAKKFDIRFINKKKELSLIIFADLIYKEEVKSEINTLKTFILIWEVKSDVTASV